MNKSLPLEVQIDGYDALAFAVPTSALAAYADRPPIELARELSSRQPRLSSLQAHADALRADGGLEHSVVELALDDVDDGAYRVSSERRAGGVRISFDAREGERRARVPARGAVAWPARLGEVLVVMVRFQLRSLAGATVCGVVGLLPWFAVGAEFAGSVIPIDALLLNQSTSPLPVAVEAQFAQLRSPLPIARLGNGDEPAAPTASMLAVLSFALRWHMIGAAVRNERVRQEQRRKLLHRRSFRFFGAEPPRAVLFGSVGGITAICLTIRQLAQPRVSAFACSQLTAALKFILHDEAASGSALARRRIYDQFFVPLANALGGMPEPIPSAAGLALREQFEPLSMRTGTLGEWLDSKELSPDAALWLYDNSSDRSAAVDDGEDDAELLRSTQLRTHLCAAFRLAGGSPNVASLMIDEIVPMREYALVNGGDVYVCDPSVLLRRCYNLFDFFLGEHAGGAVTSAASKQVRDAAAVHEQRFKAAMARSGTKYEEEGRDRSFDDCTLQSRVHQAVHSRLDAAQFRDFKMGRATTLTLPDDFDEARHWNLYREPLPDAVARGAVDEHLHALSLHAAAHRDECFGARSSQRPRAHIDVRFDVDDREGTAGAVRAAVMSVERATRLDNLRAALTQNARLVRDRQRYERLAADARRKNTVVAEAPPPANARSPLDDIEDIGANLSANGALPACVAQFAHKLLKRREHLKNEDRTIYYRLLASLQLPELDHAAIKRHMLRETPSDKLQDQLGDINKGFRRMAEKLHERAATSSRRRALERSVELSHEDALARTTCAPSCYRMKERNLCPFAWRNNGRGFFNLMLESGVDQTRAMQIAELVAKGARPAFELCKLHAHAMHTSAAIDPMPPQIAHARIYHPRDFVYAVGRHRALQLEKKFAVDSDTASPMPED